MCLFVVVDFRFVQVQSPIFVSHKTNCNFVTARVDCTIAMIDTATTTSSTEPVVLCLLSTIEKECKKSH